MRLLPLARQVQIDIAALGSHRGSFRSLADFFPPPACLAADTCTRGSLPLKVLQAVSEPGC